jgi:serine/threonine protein kinase
MEQVSLQAEYENSVERTIVGNNGEYRLRRSKFLGRGGFGIVFAAIRKHTDSSRRPTYEEVVVKEYKKSEKWLSEEDFDKELVVFNKFKDHFNYDFLLRIYDIFQEKDSRRYYLVLEMAQGGSLFDRIKDPMREDEVYEFARRSAEILHYLHF